MRTMTVSEVARNFSSVMDEVEFQKEEIILMRNRKPVARLMPEPAEMTAIEVLGDIYSTLDDETAESLFKAIRGARKDRRGTLNELRNPWTSCRS